MIEIRNLTVRYDQKTIFQNCSFDLPDEGIILLTGESGIGKTTLLYVLSGLLKTYTGSVIGLNDRKISFVFQEPRLLDRLTALENVALVSDPRLLEHLSAIDNISLVSDKQTAVSLLEKLNLSDVAQQPAGELSGGQKQRVSLARAFAFTNDVVLLDEPFTGLDDANKARAIDLIRTARLAVVVSHDPNDKMLLFPDRNINL